MSAVADFADVKRRWEDEVPDEVDIRLVDIWCPATVVGYNQRKTLFDCRLQTDIKVTMGPKGFLGRRPNTIIYKKEEIVPNVTARSIRRRIQADPLNPEGKGAKMSISQDNAHPAQAEQPTFWQLLRQKRPTGLEYALAASLFAIFILGVFANGH